MTEIKIKTNDDIKYDNLVSLLKKLKIGTNEINANSKEFLSQFKCSVTYLHDKKINDPNYFEQFNHEELLEFLLKETFIKSNTMPSESDILDMNAVFFSSGQLITLCENFITYDNIKKLIVTENIWIPHMMAKYPTTKQYEICDNLLIQHHLHINVKNNKPTEKVVESIWDNCFRYIDDNKKAKYVEFVNIIDTCKLLKKLISKHLPDSPAKILIVTVQPQQTALALETYFRNRNYPHKFYFAKNTTEDIEKSKSLYFNESIGERAGFLLRDLVEEIDINIID